MANAAQIRVLALTRRACERLDIPPVTLKHRTLSGTETTVGNNKVLKGRTGTATLETTTDYQVYVTALPLKQRGGAMDIADTAAGASTSGQMQCQCPALDIDGNPIELADNDWIQLADGSLWQIQNPAIVTDLSHWTFAATTLK